jgi:hypothetical protein
VTLELNGSAVPPRWLYLVVLIAGLGISTLGLAAGGLFILLSLRERQVTDALSVATISLSMVALGLGCGSALVWIGYQGLQRRLSRPFRPGAKWLWGSLAGLGLSLFIGQLILSFDLLAPVTFPVFHVLAMALPAILMLILVGQGLKQNAAVSTQRSVMGQIAVGAFGATAIAFTMEALVAAVGLIIIGVGMALLPGGSAQLVEVQALLADPAQLQDPQVLAHWLLKPGILIPAGVMLVIVVPLTEEAAKSIGVPLMALVTRRKPSPAQGWLLGVAVGTGFALTEGLFNGAANMPFWVVIALLRIGATAMHVATAGLTGLGWARTLMSKRFLSLLSSYLGSVTLHGTWNGLTILIAVSSVWIMSQPGDSTKIAVGGLGVLVGLIGMVILILTIIGVGTYLTRQAKKQAV